MDSNTTFISKSGLQRFYTRIYDIFASKNHYHKGTDVDAATTIVRGTVQPDGTTVKVTNSGVISVPVATNSANGLFTGGEKVKLTGIATSATKTEKTDETTLTITDVNGQTTTFTGALPATATPLMDGTATAGTSAKYAREDHKHPVDTSRAPLASPGLTGTPTAPTATKGTKTTQIATTAFVDNAIQEVPSADKLTTARAIDGVNFDGTADINHFGTCSTAAATAEKAVACTGFKLVSGALIAVKFTVTNTAAVGSLTLNVNSTGAKNIKYRGGNILATNTLSANRTYLFVYDGTNYELIGDLDTNTTVAAATAAPKMDGTATVGTSTKYAKEDHVHPTDTTRMAANLKGATNGVAELDAGGTVPSSQLPLMSESTKGGAKLGHGLTVEDGALGIGSVTDATDAGPIVELTADGWAEQDSTTGKNLLPNLNNNTVTTNGITFSKNADGSLHVSGTATNHATYFMISLSDNYTLPSGTLSILPQNSNKYCVLVNLYDDSTQVKQDFLHTLGITTADSSQYTFNKIVSLVIVYNGRTVDDDIYPQVELGSQATSYEPYTGAKPSPNPDYPQEIRRCVGRNLIENTATSRTINGVTFTVNADGSVRCNGTATAGTSFNLNPSLSFERDTYTLSSENALPSGVTLAVQSADGNQTVTAGTHATFTSSVSGLAWIRINNGVTVNNLVIKPQLEAGSTVHPYVPYGCVGVDVHSGKNLADEENPSHLYVASGKIVGPNSGATSYIIAVERNTDYTVTSVGGNRSRVFGTGSTYPVVGVSAATIRDSITGTSPFTFNSGANDYVIVLLGSEGVVPTNVQIEKGSTATAYQPYRIATIPIPLPSRGWVAALPDGTADTLTLDGAGGYEWELNVIEEIWDGSEGWWLPSDTPRRFLLNNPNRVPREESSTTELFSHFIYVPTNNRPFGGARINTSGYRIVPDNGSAMADVNEFKSWLTSNPVTVLYPLASPTTERGYVDSMPTVPAHATISCHDLTDLAVRCCADEGAAEIAQAWKNRLELELGEAITDLAADVVSKTKIDNSTIKRNSNGELYVDIQSLMGVSY